MKIRKIHLILFLFILSIYLSPLTFLNNPSLAQTQNNKQVEPIWKSKLYEKDVKYENFACSKDDSETVATFFKEHPLKSFLPICHNNCPIIKCRPVIPFPKTVKAARVTGTASVHILVDEKGKVLYARVLSGHPLLQSAVIKGACETQFREYPVGKHQGIMHFTVDDYEFLGVPNRANEVSW
jgi:hypothetical protein